MKGEIMMILLYVQFPCSVMRFFARLTYLRRPLCFLQIAIRSLHADTETPCGPVRPSDPFSLPDNSLLVVHA
jgi:hypothetical protein